MRLHNDAYSSPQHLIILSGLSHAQCEPALICDENRVLVVDLQLLDFSDKLPPITQGGSEDSNCLCPPHGQLFPFVFCLSIASVVDFI